MAVHDQGRGLLAYCPKILHYFEIVDHVCHGSPQASAATDGRQL
jgi:hypothetical protein